VITFFRVYYILSAYKLQSAITAVAAVFTVLLQGASILQVARWRGLRGLGAKD
jgi:hypothetical protein